MPAMLATSNEEYQKIVEIIKKGYTDKDGRKHAPRPSIAFAIQLEATTGLRISDIVKLKLNDIVKEGNRYRLDIREKKTKKKRSFTITEKTYKSIKEFCNLYGIKNDQIIINKSIRSIQENITFAARFLNLERVNTHSFRKMAAGRVYDLTNKDIVATSAFLQHSSPSITMRYLTKTSEVLEEALQKMDI